MPREEQFSAHVGQCITIPRPTVTILFSVCLVCMYALALDNIFSVYNIHNQNQLLDNSLLYTVLYIYSVRKEKKTQKGNKTV